MGLYVIGHAFKVLFIISFYYILLYFRLTTGIGALSNLKNSELTPRKHSVSSLISSSRELYLDIFKISLKSKNFMHREMNNKNGIK